MPLLARETNAIKKAHKVKKRTRKACFLLAYFKIHFFLGGSWQVRNIRE